MTIALLLSPISCIMKGIFAGAFLAGLCAQEKHVLAEMRQARHVLQHLANTSNKPGKTSKIVKQMLRD